MRAKGTRDNGAPEVGAALAYWGIARKPLSHCAGLIAHAANSTGRPATAMMQDPHSEHAL